MGMAPCSAMASLVRGGLRWSAIGMDFSGVWAQNASAPGKRALQRVIDYYFGGCAECVRIIEFDNAWRHGPRADTDPYLRGCTDCGNDAWRHPLANQGVASGRARELAQLRRDGFVKFDDFGIDISLLEAAISQAFDKARGEAVVQVAPRLPAFEPLLRNRELLELASLYLGADAVVTGYKLLRLGTGARRDDFFSGFWHHDGCGKRLKLLFYLQDVRGGADCPTHIAMGSQHTAFFWYGSQSTFRFSDAYVERHYPLRKMLGPRGGGFIFDTNTVHRGHVDGEHEGREVLVADIMSRSKLEANLPTGGPCPEPGTYSMH